MLICTTIGFAESVEDFCGRPENKVIRVETACDDCNAESNYFQEHGCERAIWLIKNNPDDDFRGNPQSISGDITINFPSWGMRSNTMRYIRENVTD